jgi:SAM-dependent methyltransferase
MGLPMSVLSELVCPACNGSLRTHKSPSLDYVSCEACGKHFPVSSSVVSFVTNLKEQDVTASTFGYEWKAFVKGVFDKDNIFGLRVSETLQYFLSRVGLSRQDLAGLRVLDAGTGGGRIPKSLRDTSCHVYAVDIHKSLNLVAEQCKDLENASFFRADLFELPFKDDFIDIAWSSGVIHHTPDPAKAFTAIARKVKPGGRIFISVYGKDLHHYRLLRRLMPFARHLPPQLIYVLSSLMAIPVYFGFNAALLLVRLLYRNQKPPYRLFGFTVESSKHQSYRSILLTMFDQLHPHYQSEHTVDEVRGWFLTNGLGDIEVVESIGMVGIRGIKPEQYYAGQHC